MSLFVAPSGSNGEEPFMALKLGPASCYCMCLPDDAAFPGGDDHEETINTGDEGGDDVTRSRDKVAFAPTDSEKIIKDVSSLVLPPQDGEEFGEARKRFMTTVTVASQYSEEAVILPARRLSMSTLDQPLDFLPDLHEGGEEGVGSRSMRIATTQDVSSLENWWGTGPQTPDRRLEASMPQHVRVSEVHEVVVKKSANIEKLRDELPLDELCSEGDKFVLWQMTLGKVCLLSLHCVIDDDAFEKLTHQGDKLLQDSLKLIVTPVNLALSIPVKGPKDADTIGSFFGAKNTHFSRPGKNSCKYDIALLSVDLYSVWSLKMLLPSVAFTPGRMVDFHLVSYRDNAALASFRCAMTPEVIAIIKKLGL